MFRHAARAALAVSKLSPIALPTQSVPPPPTCIASVAIFSMPMIEVKYDGFTLPDSFCAAAGGINSFYVRWMEAVGVRVYILQWDDPWECQLALLEQVNGVLFPGGDLDHFQTVLEQYFQQVCQVYRYALDRSRRHNDPFVCWGTCQGFQLLCAAAAEDLSIIEGGYVGTECKMLPLELTPEQQDSVFLSPKTTPPHVLRAMQETCSTLNVHRFGVSPSSFQQNSKLQQAFRVLSVNSDSQGRPFVSTIEHREAPIYAVQWHPEWPPYDFSDERVEQTEESIAVSLYVSQFIRSRLRQNAHHFQTIRSMEGSVIERSPLTYEGFGWQLYWSRAQREAAGGKSQGDDFRLAAQTPTTTTVTTTTTITTEVRNTQ